MCETCMAMMMPAAETAPVSVETNAVPAASFNPAFQTAKPVSFETVQPDNSFEPNHAATDNFQSNYQPQASHFAPSSFENRPPRFAPPVFRQPLPPVEKEYKPSVWNWITELPTFVKVGAVVLVFAVIFAFALKSFMTMDVSIVNNGNLEPQKPWFSSWTRSKPTAEEILDKHEKATFTDGKTLVSAGFTLSGSARIIKISGEDADMTKLKKDPTAPFKPAANSDPTIKTPNMPSYVPEPMPNRTDFEITFDISVKNPNKMAMQLMMKPKEGFSQSFMAYKTEGFNGDSGWTFTRSIMKGNETIRDETYQPNNFFYNRTEAGVTPAIQRSMYSKLELVGEEVVYNRRAYNVKTTTAAGETANVFFDIETGLVLKIRRNNANFYILEYESLEGVRYPSKMSYQIYTDWIVLSVEKFQSNAPLDDAIFRRTSYK